MRTNYCDYIIVGSGIAGLYIALLAIERGSVLILTKGSIEDCNTRYAQGGIAVAMGRDDSPALHFEDTISAGAGLSDAEAAHILTEEAADCTADLIRFGVPFDTLDGEITLTREAAHSVPRVMHAGGDATGEHIEVTLSRQVRSTPIKVLENFLSIEILFQNGKVIGVRALDCRTGSVEEYHCQFLILATGGAGRVFLYTSNPDVATGDGIAMAYRAGASVTNMELYQFHPTLLFHPKIRASLISEALRGEGALLLGSDGQRFMQNYHPDAELAPRDVVARAIDNELKKTGTSHVWLDISFKNSEFIKDRFPAIYETCLSAGVDMTKEPIPVVPAAHYLMGGVKVDKDGRTDVKGLYAIGETACSGLHGANRLASNSLLEAAVMASYASRAALVDIQGETFDNEIPPWDPGEATDPDELVIISHQWDEIRRIMSYYVGIVRSHKRLIRARNRIGFIAKEIMQFYWNYQITEDLIELRNIALVAELIIKMARMRKECRGAHYNKDFTEEWIETVDTVLKKGFLPIDS